ncbi:MAG TPA: hypothetical protein VMG35_17415, partial [Bryobacteraceae bacterium]|nr:hypothetical protein [Bryobacteraceae bacterium]
HPAQFFSKSSAPLWAHASDAASSIHGNFCIVRSYEWRKMLVNSGLHTQKEGAACATPSPDSSFAGEA